MLIGSGSVNLWSLKTMTNNDTVTEFYSNLDEKFGGDPTYENVKDVIIDQMINRLE